VVNVQLSEEQEEQEDQEDQDEQDEQDEDQEEDQDDDDQEEDQDDDDQEEDDQEEDQEDDDQEEDQEDDDQEEQEEDEDEDEDEEQEEEDISETIKRIENHTMQFDFMLSEVPTAQTLEHDSKEGVHVMKYDGFPRDSAGIHFYDRKFVPVDHRMMEVVLQHEGKEYDLNLASPDNFYVAGNKVLDPAFVKWFMLKNHGIQISVHHGSEGVKCDYIIKCVDNTAALHTLQPHNYLHVSLTGFEIQDSGLV
jgi:hypothetical protein